MNHATQKAQSYSFFDGSFKASPLKVQKLDEQELILESKLPDEVLPYPTSNKTVGQLQSTMGQSWLHNSKASSWSDQFGFVIQKDSADPKPFALYKGDIFVTRCYRLHTAKLISTIMINDIILYKSLPENENE